MFNDLQHHRQMAKRKRNEYKTREQQLQVIRNNVSEIIERVDYEIDGTIECSKHSDETRVDVYLYPKRWDDIPMTMIENQVWDRAKLTANHLRGPRNEHSDLVLNLVRQV